MISRSSVFLMCLTLLFLSSFCSAASPDRELAGNGTAADPFRIRNADDLRVMTDSQYRHAYFVLTNDIELMPDRQYDINLKINNSGGWEPAGFSDSAAFSGILDGQNHTISNLYSAGPDSSGGLFHIIQNASVKNLNFKNVYIQTYSEKWPSKKDDFFKNFSAGTLTNELHGDVFLENINIEGTVIGKSNVGGFAGFYTSENGSIGVKMNNCFFNGTVEGESSVGGMIGSTLRTEISNSSVSGTVRSQSGDGGGIGGFAGSLGRGSLLQNVYCDADVTGNFYSGGLAGTVYNSQILGGHFTGNVTGIGQTGGFTGRVSGNSTISKSSFEGTVTGSINAGGFAGECGQYYDADIPDLIQESYAAGNITGEENVGGLVGSLIHGTLSDSYFVGNVSAKNNSAGGLAGVLMSANISGCYAAGTVHASKNAGGLVGFYTPNPFIDSENETASFFSNAFALNEKVTAKNNAGSIFGCIDAENETIPTAELINVYAWNQMSVTPFTVQNPSVSGEYLSSAEILNQPLGSGLWESFSPAVWKNGSSSYSLPLLYWQEPTLFNAAYLERDAEIVNGPDSNDKKGLKTKGPIIVILSAAVVGILCFSVFLFYISGKRMR